MKIQEAVQALRDGKTVSSANAMATIKPTEAEGQKRVIVTRIKRNGDEDTMDLTLSRIEQLYSQHDFALGQYKSATPPANKQAAPAETK